MKYVLTLALAVSLISSAANALCIRDYRTDKVIYCE